MTSGLKHGSTLHISLHHCFLTYILHLLYFNFYNKFSITFHLLFFLFSSNIQLFVFSLNLYLVFTGPLILLSLSSLILVSSIQQVLTSPTPSVKMPVPSLLMPSVISCTVLVLMMVSLRLVTPLKIFPNWWRAHSHNIVSQN